MPRALICKGPESGVRAFLATPAYSGLSGDYVQSLFSSQAKLLDQGISCDLELMTENCHVDDGRNMLVRDFLETDCEMLVFLDTDIAWNADDLVKLIKSDRDIVAGIYPLKKVGQGYPVKLFEGIQQAEDDGLLEVYSVPTGFLKITRKVIEDLVKVSSGYKAEGDTKQSLEIPIIFERTLEDGNRWGGDYTFCRKAKALGYKIYIDPEMEFKHFGENVWSGCIGDYLRDENNIQNPKLTQALNELRGEYTVKTFADIYRHWGNDWAASPELLMTCFEVAKQHNEIFECGSGISTIVMALTGNKVTAYESDYLWYKKVKTLSEVLGLDINLVYSPIKDYGDFQWYSDLPPKFDLALVDGPVRLIGREGFYKLADYENATLLIDDYLDIPILRNRVNLTFGEEHPFIISRPECLKKSA